MSMQKQLSEDEQKIIVNMPEERHEIPEMAEIVSSASGLG